MLFSPHAKPSFDTAAYVDSNMRGGPQFIRTQVVENHQGETFRAVKLVSCEVGDEARLCYIDGQWWRLDTI